MFVHTTGFIKFTNYILPSMYPFKLVGLKVRELLFFVMSVKEQKLQ